MTKFTKTLTILEEIELLNLLRIHSVKEVAEILVMKVESVEYYRRKHNVLTNCEIDIYKVDRAIYKLEQEYKFSEQPVNYERQETCVSKKMTYHCYTCDFTASENSADKIVEHVQRHLEVYPKKLLTWQKI